MTGFLGSSPLVRRALHLWFLASRGTTLGVRVAAFDHHGRIFLVRHTYAEGWHMPGGGVEVGETARDAAARELAEEAELAVAAEPRLHGVFFNRHASRRDHVLVYVADEVRILGAKKPDREIAEAGFFAPDALPDGLTPGTRRRLDEIAGARPLSPDW